MFLVNTLDVRPLDSLLLQNDQYFCCELFLSLIRLNRDMLVEAEVAYICTLPARTRERKICSIRHMPLFASDLPVVLVLKTCRTSSDYISLLVRPALRLPYSPQVQVKFISRDGFDWHAGECVPRRLFWLSWLHAFSLP